MVFGLLFRETGVFGENEGANEPDGFEFEVRSKSGGKPLPVNGAGFFALSATTGQNAFDPIGTIEPPDDGRYVVSLQSDVGDAHSPTLSFGTGSSGQVPRLTTYWLVAIGIDSLLLVSGVVRSSRRESI